MHLTKLKTFIELIAHNKQSYFCLTFLLDKLIFTLLTAQ